MPDPDIRQSPRSSRRQSRFRVGVPARRGSLALSLVACWLVVFGPAQAQQLGQAEPPPPDLEQAEPAETDLAEAEDVMQAEPAPPEPQRRVRQLQTNDGVIEITNRAQVAPAPSPPPPVTVTRRLKAEPKARVALPVEPAPVGGSGWVIWVAALTAGLVGAGLVAWVMLRRRRSRFRDAFSLEVGADSLFEPGRDSQPLSVGTPAQGHGSGRQWLSQPPLRGKQPEN